MPALTQDVQATALSLMVGLNCPRSLTVAILIRYGEWDQLTSLEADPKHYTSADSYFRANAATEFLRKFDGFDLELDLHADAVEKWRWSEQECFKTNLRLYPFVEQGPLGGGPTTCSIGAYIRRLQSNVRLLIGDRPPTLLEGRFGPGATVSDVSQRSTIPDKMSSVPTLTPNALFHLVPWSGTLWSKASASLGNSPQFVRGNHFFTVPKTSRSLRGCGKEPSINVHYQLALGSALRERLMRHGYDLTSLQAVHRRLAQEGSKTGLLATIDLSSASDTVATALVELLLPPSWHEVLCSLRSPYTRVDGKWCKLEKFSSMGNGFTFELETVIFLAICLTSVPDSLPGVDVSVYGDDIIVPTEFASEVLSALRFFGFTPNPKKTFVEGSFRESCGGDFFNGVPVRAHYLKEEPDEPQKVISLANGVRRLAYQGESAPVHYFGDVQKAWFSCLDRLPANIRSCRGPEALGDLVIHDVQCHWETRWRRSVRSVKCYRPAEFKRVRFDGFAYDVQFAAAIYGIFLHGTPGDTEFFDERWLIPRGGVRGYTVSWVPYS